jgi:hypothetical protein
MEKRGRSHVAALDKETVGTVPGRLRPIPHPLQMETEIEFKVKV